MKVKGEDGTEGLYNWDEKGCELVNAAAQELKMDKIPDMDELIEKFLRSKERFKNARQGTTSKAPKVKPGQLLGMKQGK